MSESVSDRPLEEKLRILVAVRVPEPEQISPLLIELYRPLKVFLLGLYGVPDQTVERVVVERDCHAVVLLKPGYELHDILAALRPGPMATRILHFLAELLADTDYRATLLYVPDAEGEEVEEARRELELLQRELLEREGIGADRVETELGADEDREEAVLEAAGRHDLVLVGETEPSVREEIFGDFSRRLADEADVPVIVVRREL